MRTTTPSTTRRRADPEEDVGRDGLLGRLGRGGLALGWLIYTRLTPTTGWFAFVLIAYSVACCSYAVVTLVGNSMMEVRTGSPRP